MFVVSLTYTAPEEEVAAKRAEHREWLDPHVASGLLLVTGPKASRDGGVLIVSGKIDADALNALLTEDPFHVHGLARYEVMEFDANKIHPALVGLT